jgi:hypothetical protein
VVVSDIFPMNYGIMESQEATGFSFPTAWFILVYWSVGGLRSVPGCLSGCLWLASCCDLMLDRSLSWGLVKFSGVKWVGLK